MPVTSRRTLRIDDTDPSIIYQGAWLTGGGIEEYNHTAHGFNTASASAELTFKGTQVALYGTLEAKDASSPDPLSEIRIDGELVSTYKPTLLDSNIQYRQAIFKSEVLSSDKEHTISITSLVESNNTIWLDYIEYILSPSPISPHRNKDALSSQPTTSWRDSVSLEGEGVSGSRLFLMFLFILVCLTCIWLWRRRVRRPPPDLRNYRPPPRGFVRNALEFVEKFWEEHVDQGWRSRGMGGNVRTLYP
ncbi:hypothetical protein K435DRAFT_838188 [Dendrothele bispora CBS 962.96]|uniref:Uncharacterized protein n=1 Tax=Dendrothele bispora (strain CBS 962.96) TaxID=1314807 RepID=A0A4V4HGD2_DENBC|nr:hypothetical protein K435DRAFT_838188 [Dendrothele bispora CBS 962.96]